MKLKKTVLKEATDAYRELSGEGKLPTKEEADKMLADAQAQKANAEKVLADAKEIEKEKLAALAEANDKVNASLNEVAENRVS